MAETPAWALEKIREAKEKRLTELDLGRERNDRREQLAEIPAEVFQLIGLEILSLPRNQITVIPESISNLVNLTELDLYSNQITVIPESISNLINLNDLNLGKNQITVIPESISNLVNLTKLYLSSNKVLTIPESISNLVNLTELYLSYNQVTVIPESISNLVNLTELYLSYNQVTVIPESISNLVNLTELYLSFNQITVIPESISNLVNLTELDLRKNQITVIPESISNLVNLTELDFSFNYIGAISESIFKLVKLTKLNLSYNEIPAISESISNLVKLNRLDLSSNQITVIPESISNLVSLTTLDLSNNQITVISESISNLVNLTTLDLFDNPIETPPLEVVERGLEAIREYFRQLSEQGTDQLYEAKLLIIGEGGAGKTTLSKKIQNGDYQLQEEESTEGIEVTPWNFPMDSGQSFRVNIWDFGGQEIYHATHQFFLTKRSLYLLVADTRKEDTDFYYWLNIVELLSDNSPLLIIKNEKQDRQREISDNQLRGQFSNLEKTLATNLATNRGFPEVLQAIKRYITALPHIGTTLPKTWVRVRVALEADSRNHISLDAYLTLCQHYGFTQHADKLQLSGYLHDLGVCLHFQDDPLLKKTVILKPKWGTDAVYKVLDNPQVIHNLGQFTQTDLATIWSDEQYTQMQDELLRLMMKFKLCYEIPGHPGTYIAPQLLTENQPEYPWDDSHNLILRYTYDFMPKGILTQFIVNLHELIQEQHHVWKSGVILHKDNTRAEVIEHYGKREIKIRIMGRYKRDLMTIVTHELDKIHAAYKRLKYQKWIPCNCSDCKGNQNPHFYRFESLKRRLDNKQSRVECDLSYTMVEVLGLVDDVMDRASWLHAANHHSQKPLLDLEPDMEPEKEVFISYAWGGDSEAIVNQLDQAFQHKGITLIRDKRDLGFKGRIKEFMQRIGRGKCVVVVISEKYLKSENCMFELVQIAKNGEFYDRIFPIVLSDANIYKPIQRLQYVKHWEAQIQELDEGLKTVGAANLQGFRDDIDLYTEIRGTIAELINILKDMNTLTPEMHTESGFEQLFHSVERKLAE